MSTSQNGWEVLASSDGLDNRPVSVFAPVPLAPGVRAGDVATILRYVAAQFHIRVERLHNGWCWGYNYRPIRGETTGFSNHASATAIDLNAPLHSRQPTVRYLGFSLLQVAEIRRILAECSGAVNWGSDFTVPPSEYDPMHFEIHGSAAEVHAAALKLIPAPPYTGPYIGKVETFMVDVPIVKLGSKDSLLPHNPVAFVQRECNSHGCHGLDGKALTVDGNAGPNTVAALKAFQKAFGLPQTGVTDAVTLATFTLG